jgi:hypothetical protein
VLYGDDAFYTLLTRVRDANATALTNTIGGAPSRIGIVPGAIAWDDCDCGAGGLLALGTVRTYLSDEFPNELSEVTGGGSGVLICGDFSVQAIRCAPSPSTSGDAPSVDALDRSARDDCAARLVWPRNHASSTASTPSASLSAPTSSMLSGSFTARVSTDL